MITILECKAVMITILECKAIMITILECKAVMITILECKAQITLAELNTPDTSNVLLSPLDSDAFRATSAVASAALNWISRLRGRDRLRTRNMLLI